MLVNFFRGFCKQAASTTAEPTVISDWLSEAAKEQKKVRDKKPDKKVDPRELSEWQGPEAWYRNWP